MLFRVQHLKGIADGRYTLAYRRWNKPHVKKGSLLKTAVGLIEISGIKEVQAEDITGVDARKAGFESLESLMAELSKGRTGSLYRINVRYAGADPRLALRAQTKISEPGWVALKTKLKKMDDLSREGPWTQRVMEMIHRHPQRRALEIASELDVEKDWLKIRVRRLKNLGLTISHESGYSLSPLGNLVLKKIQGKNSGPL